MSTDIFNIGIECPRKLLYAFSHNRIPLVRRLKLTTLAADLVGPVRLDLSLSWTREERAPAKTYSVMIESAASQGEALTIEDLPFRLDDAVMVDLEEAVPATLGVALTTQDGRQQHAEVEVQVLARHQWALVPGYEDLLASYVQPNHPVTKDVLKAAAEILRERTGKASIEGYQSGPERAQEIGRALFEALQGWNLTYVNPPASFEDFQKVRPLDEVLEGRAGTCIDLACAYASCLEQAGLRPLLWVVPGHAFAGFMLEDTQLDTSVIRDVNSVLNLTDSKLAVAVEAVCLTDGRSFGEALAETRLRLVPTSEMFVIDVHRAHLSGALPLPARVVRDGVVTIVVDPGPGAAPAVEQRSVATGKRLTDSVPLRVSRWKSNLLDLSFRNPLLGFSTRRQGLDVLVPPGTLGKLEDALLEGKALKIMPGDRLEGAQTAAGLRSITEASSAVTTELYEKLGLLYTPSGEDEGKKRAKALATKTRLIESETGANNLYLVLGKLVWQRKVASGGSAEVESPLFLLPVRIQRPKGGALFYLEADEGATTTANYCLIEKLKGDYNLDVSGLEQPDADDSGIDVMGAIQELRRALQSRGLPFRVDETAHLAILQYSKFRIWKDMAEHWETFLENDVVRHMVERTGEPFEATSHRERSKAPDEDELGVLCPVPADGAQLKAISRALHGDSFVLQGPPGTGKSQTITNLLASALARGKTVLFVAEKQAALSVVRDRLASVGLLPYCLDLHDKGSKPQQIRDQLKIALEAEQDGDDRQFRQVQSALGAEQKRLNDYRNNLYDENAQGFSFATAFEESLRLGVGPAATVPTSTLLVAPTTLEKTRNTLNEAGAAVEVVRPSSQHPWRLVATGEFAQLDKTALAEALLALERALGNLDSATPTLKALLGEAKDPSDLRDLVVFLAGMANGTAPSEAVRQGIATGNWSEQVAEAITQLRQPVEHLLKLQATLRGTVFNRPVEELDQALIGVKEASKSFFLIRRGNTRRALQNMVGATEAPKLPWQECLRLGESIVGGRKALGRRFADLKAAAVDKLPSSFRPTDLASYEDLATWIGNVTEVAVVTSRADEFGAAIRSAAQDPHPMPTGTPEKLRELADALDEVFERLLLTPADAAAWLGGQGLLTAISAVLPEWLMDSVGARFLRLQRWMDLKRDLEPVREVGLSKFVDDILLGAVPAEEVGSAFARGLARTSLEERTLTSGLDGFDRVRHEQAIERYTERLQERQGLLKRAIPNMLLASRSFDSQIGYGEVNELRVELNRKRKALSVRQLFEKFPALIQQLTPCFLMSPSSVAQFIAPGTMRFDMVVFDEASQIDVAEAIGAMGRANSVVIVGDSKQMPPTRLFDAGNTDDGLSSAPVNDDEEAAEDGESLLVEATDSIQMEQEWLSWHYRSQDESLIAFSNETYYDNNLSTFPSPTTGRRAAISWHRVGGQFGHGKARTNPIEASAVVQEVLKRVHDPATANESIGIVTLNRQQQDEVLKQLEDTADLKVLDLLNSDTDDALLVRNLENIQGQERDVIIFSTGFSRPEAGGKMPLNFGPLNRQGGERRLNVAITRARRELLVFSSFDPEEIEPGRTAAIGILHLRGFLEMARSGPSRTATSSAQREALENYRNDVKRALEERGLEVKTDMGLSPFKVDLAARPHGAPDWRAAILLDGARWSKRRSAVDRDALPVTVLRGLMGWPAVLRVWLPSWRAERAAVVDALYDQIIGAEPPTVKIGDGGAKDLPEHLVPTPVIEPVTPDPPPGTREPCPPVENRPLADLGFGTKAARPEPANVFRPYPDTPALGTQAECTQNWVSGRVKATILDAIEFEGPVELRRLLKLVAARYGVNRLHEGRAKAIQRHVPRGQMDTSSFRTFVWPKGIEPESYGDFRHSRDKARNIDEISPQELGNAMRWLVSKSRSMQHDELLKATAPLFGFKQMTAELTSHLERACLAAVRSGRLRVSGDRYTEGEGS